MPPAGHPQRRRGVGVVTSSETANPHQRLPTGLLGGIHRRRPAPSVSHAAARRSGSPPRPDIWKMRRSLPCQVGPAAGAGRDRLEGRRNVGRRPSSIGRGAGPGRDLRSWRLGRRRHHPRRHDGRWHPEPGTPLAPSAAHTQRRSRFGVGHPQAGKRRAAPATRHGAPGRHPSSSVGATSTRRPRCARTRRKRRPVVGGAPDRPFIDGSAEFGYESP